MDLKMIQLPEFSANEPYFDNNYILLLKELVVKVCAKENKLL